MARGVAAAVMATAGVGCQFGPEHLDFLYAQRDAWQRHIDTIEKQHGLEPLNPSDGESRVQKLLIEKLQRENLELSAQNSFLSSEMTSLSILHEGWFKALSPDQQLQYKMHRDLVIMGAKAEIKQNVQQFFGPKPRQEPDPPPAAKAP